MKTLRERIGRVAGNLLRNRRLVRAPIWIYRARLGAVFGHRLLMLEHRGRKTGAKRYAVLEVIDHPAADQYVIASGFGRRAQWFRNVRHDPRVRVYVSSRSPAPAVAELLDREQTREVLGRYSAEHPRAWEQLKPIFEQVLGSEINQTDTVLPLVRLTLEPSGDTGAAQP